MALLDTIAAVATPPGIGALAMVRVSGSEAHELLLRLAPRLRDLPAPRTSTLVDLCDPDSGEVLDRALAVRYDAPASYTGEHMVELSCHGGWLGPALILDACSRAGARKAEPGEFTRRAYLNGKLDLVEAEAVADMIEARSRAFRRAALGQMERGLSERITRVREGLVHVEALLVHHLDFPEEDDAPVPIGRVVEETEEALRRMDLLLATAPEGVLLREGALTVLAGRPNVGKSSLYNALLGEERAIVTEIAGTTRDALEATVQLGGYPFRLVDTAGLRESPERVEQMGVEVARRFLSRADLILLCVEAGSGPGAAEAEFLRDVGEVPTVLVETKGDLRSGSIRTDGDGWAAQTRVSTRTGEGLGELRELLPQLVFGGLLSDGTTEPVLTRERQIGALREARREVAGFRDALMSGLPAEVAAAHLGTARSALEEMLGVIAVDDVLDAVFREFCVGK
jgi:tRNA modification GTPase